MKKKYATIVLWGVIGVIFVLAFLFLVNSRVRQGFDIGVGGGVSDKKPKTMYDTSPKCKNGAFRNEYLSAKKNLDDLKTLEDLNCSNGVNTPYCKNLNAKIKDAKKKYKTTSNLIFYYCGKDAKTILGDDYGAVAASFH
jgi:hypothetical protein